MEMSHPPVKIFQFLLGAYGFSAGRDLYRATATVKRGLGFCGLNWEAAIWVAFYECNQGMQRSCLFIVLIYINRNSTFSNICSDTFWRQYS